MHRLNPFSRVLWDSFGSEVWPSVQMPYTAGNAVQPDGIVLQCYETTIVYKMFTVHCNDNNNNNNGAIMIIIIP